MSTESMQSPDDRRAPPSAYIGIFVCTAGVLMSEVLLTRIFSFTIWYHLAYLTVSTALLSFGAAGSLLAAFPRLLKNPPRIAGISAVAAGISLLLALAYLGPRPIDPLNMFQQPVTFSLGLLKYYIIICIPFLFSGIAIAAPLAAYPKEVNRLYGADLAGAAVGCGLAVAALTWTKGESAPVLAALLLAVSGALYFHGMRWRVFAAIVSIAIAICVPFADELLKFNPAPSKGLGTRMARDDFKTLYTQWSAVNRVDVTQNTNALRGGYWGIGVKPFYKGPMPIVTNIQYDGHNGSNIYNITGPDSMEFLDFHILRMPYVFLDQPRVLAIGIGGGIDVHNALRRGAVEVTGAELQPITVKVLKEYYDEFCGGVFNDPRVNLVAAEGRHFVRSRGGTYDLVQITATDTFSAQAAGAYVLAESYLYTVEAVEDYLKHLSDDGVFCVVLGDVRYDDPEIPPPLATRMVLTIIDALRRTGVDDPAKHVLLATPKPEAPGISSVIVARKSPYSPADMAKASEYAESVGVKFLLAPGKPGLQRLTTLANEPPETRAAMLDAEEFHVNPITDDQPFFYHIVRWGNILSARGALWYFPGSATGQIVLLLMLGQAIVIGGLLILAPLLLRARSGLKSKQTVRFLFYFLALGIGFMLIEISFVQKYVLLLGYPTYSLSVTIVSLLVFAAVGAAISKIGWANPRRMILTALTIMVALVIVEVAVLPVLREAMLGSSLIARIAVTVLFQCPLGLCLGTFFPTGVEQVRQRAPELVPWAWAINGIGSVAGTVLAVILAMAFGFSTVALIALAVYLVGTVPLALSLNRTEV